uniref:TspO/MBR-related protein n=1 Tax=Setaria digitata TaxID=48799 RepID=A0A915PNA9_9BILA
MLEPLYMQRYDHRFNDPLPFGSDMTYSTTAVNSVWTSDDTKHAILFSLVPGALSACAATSFRKERNLVEWWLASKKPNWAPENPVFYGLFDFMTIAPLGYASYVAYKFGGGLSNNSTKLALALYGSSIMSAFLTMSLLFRNTLIMHLTGAGAAFAFFKIDHKAGLLLAPYVLWTGFYTFLTYAMNKLNTSEAGERSIM